MKLKIEEEKEGDVAMISLEKTAIGNVVVKSVVKGEKHTELVICPDGTKHYPNYSGNFKEQWK